jgi:hypothetical protein
MSKLREWFWTVATLIAMLLGIVLSIWFVRLVASAP